MKLPATTPSIGRLIRTTAITCIIAGPISLTAYLLFVDVVLSHAVPRAEELGFAPSTTPIRALPERQAEIHTCGLHCLRSLYRAHNLDPDRHALRFRLGVDRGAIPTMNSTQGTLQPDLTRVLAQDGFLVEALDVGTTDDARILEQHLRESLLAVALIRKPANGNLHWVLLQDTAAAEAIEIVDSLAEMPYRETAGAFLRKKAVSVFLVEPNHGDTKREIKRAHRLGVSALKKTPGRVKVLASAH